MNLQKRLLKNENNIMGKERIDRPRLAEVVLYDDKIILIRKRETISDMERTIVW